MSGPVKKFVRCSFCEKQACAHCEVCKTPMCDDCWKNEWIPLCPKHASPELQSETNQGELTND